MSLAQRIADVRRAQLRVARSNAELQSAGDGLLADSRAHPLTTLAVAAGAGTVLGTLKLPAVHVPGMAGLLAGGLVEATALAARLLADLAIVDTAVKAAANTEHAADQASSPVPDSADA